MNDVMSGIDHIPEHVAIIMDGNGRWAKERGFPRAKGHEEGAKAVQQLLDVVFKTGVSYLTLYAFSEENWNRPKAEISSLMLLLKRVLNQYEADFIKKGVRLRVIGRREKLPSDINERLDEVCERTGNGVNGTLVLALSYGGRAEIIDATRKMIREGLSDGEVTEERFRSYLYAPDIPDPDLLIRTSGEMRVSNFLLWQLSYSELYITPVLWPDFSGEDFMNALRDYNQRTRRFGGVR